MSQIQINKYIVADSEICHGKPTFKGTRIMVWQILEMIAGGETIKEILKDFPSLNKFHIAAAFEYAARLMEGERFFAFKRHSRRHHEVLS